MADKGVIMERRSFFGWLASGILSILGWSKRKPAQVVDTPTPARYVSHWKVEMSSVPGVGLLAEDVEVTGSEDQFGQYVLVRRLVGPEPLVKEFFRRYADPQEASKPENELLFVSLNGPPRGLRVRAVLTQVGLCVEAQGVAVCERVEMYARAKPTWVDCEPVIPIPAPLRPSE